MYIDKTCLESNMEIYQKYLICAWKNFWVEEYDLFQNYSLESL